MLKLRFICLLQYYITLRNNDAHLYVLTWEDVYIEVKNQVAANAYIACSHFFKASTHMLPYEKVLERHTPSGMIRQSNK